MKRAVRGAFRLLAACAVLVLLAIGAGAAYVWYTGQADVQGAATAAPVEPVAAPVVKPTAPAPDATISASVQMISSPVAPGDNAAMTVKTNAAAACNIKVVYDKTASTDSGLIAKVADEYGMVSWGWTVEPSVPLGKWPVKVTCANAKHSAVVQSDLVVEKPPR